MSNFHKIIVSIIGLLLIVIGILSFMQYKDYQKQVDEIKNTYEENYKLITDEVDSLEKQVEQYKKELKVLNGIKTYGFYYHTGLDKYVYQTHVFDELHSYSDIIQHYEESMNDSKVNNYFSDIDYIESEVKDNALKLSINNNQYDNYSDQEKKEFYTTLTWSLYSTFNIENLNLIINGKNSGYNLSNIYNPYTLNPINDAFGTTDDIPETPYAFPIVSKHDNYKVLETNIVGNEVALKELIEKYESEYFGLDISTFQYQANYIGGVNTFNILLEDETHTLTNEEIMKVKQQKEAYELTYPSKHYLIINKETNLTPVFLNYTLYNNPSFPQ